MTRPATLVALLMALLVTLLGTLLAGCSGAGTPETAPSPSAGTPSVTPTPPRATPPPRPDVGACYRLDYDAALAPTSRARPVPCQRPHTALTFLVGTLRTVVDGHLLAVDADRVQAQVVRTCPERLGGFLGATAAQLRLTSLRAVWFTPSLGRADRGQDWYRCDVIALAGPERLAPLTSDLKGVLASAEGRARYAVCGTAQPGAPGFERVVCSSPHTWRAIATYDVPGDTYPGEPAVREVAQQRCRTAAQAIAEDTLNYQWGYDWPTREQWVGDQRYGLCWAPDPA